MNKLKEDMLVLMEEYGEYKYYLGQAVALDDERRRTMNEAIKLFTDGKINEAVKKRNESEQIKGRSTEIRNKHVRPYQDGQVKTPFDKAHEVFEKFKSQMTAA